MNMFRGQMGNLSDEALCILHRVYCKDPDYLCLDRVWIAMKRKLVYNTMLMRIPIGFLAEINELKEQLHITSEED